MAPISTETLREHVKIITAELKDEMPLAKLRKLTLARSRPSQVQKNKELEARILEIASKVTIDVRSNYMPCYSNLHVWEMFRDIKTKDQAREAAPALLLTDTPYGNCLTMAANCYRSFEKALLAEIDPELARYASQVQLATNNFLQRPESSREHHCVVMLSLWDHFIILDPVAHGYAIKVPVGQMWYDSVALFSFIYIAISNARLLVSYGLNGLYNSLDCPQSEGKFTYNDQFTPVEGGFTGAIANLAWPSDSYVSRLPSRQTIWIQSIWDRKSPNKVRSVALQDSSRQYLVNNAYLRVDFTRRELSLDNISITGWLNRPENKQIAKRLRSRSGHMTSAEIDSEFVRCFVNPKRATGHLTKLLTQHLQFMSELCEALGLPQGELERIANVMLEVWREHNMNKPKARKRKRGGDLSYHP